MDTNKKMDEENTEGGKAVDEMTLEEKLEFYQKRFEEVRRCTEEAEKQHADVKKQRVDFEKQRVDAEKQRADDEKQRADDKKQLKEALRRADDAEKQRDEAEKQRADDEKQLKEAQRRADEAEKQRDEAERRAEAEKQLKEAQRSADEAEKQLAEAEKQLAKAEKVRAEKQLAEAEKVRAEAEKQRAEAEKQRDEAEKQLENSTMARFLDYCHHDIFLKLDVQLNDLESTGGGLTKVDGKLYPRHLQPWTEFDGLVEKDFRLIESLFGEDKLLPPTAGLSYVSHKLSHRKLASEEDLKNFEFLAVEGCVLDLIPVFLELVQKQKAKAGETVPPSIQSIEFPLHVTFNNYPYGVVASEEDEEDEEEEDDKEGGEDGPEREPSRGRTRTRSSKNKPLKIKDDRPAYLGALAIAKSDMDEAALRAAARAQEKAEADAAEEAGLLEPGSRSRSRYDSRKRHSPDKTKVHPDQWCFWHGKNGEKEEQRPLFVVEYKAAHKIDPLAAEEHLQPEAAAKLMEDVIRALAKGNTDEIGREKRDMAHVLTQTYHYMVDYGLQYSYATTGEFIIFLYLDPSESSTLYYRLVRPDMAVRSSSTIQNSAVALVSAFILMAMRGQFMSQAWKKQVKKTQPTWPTPYEDMDNISFPEMNTSQPPSIAHRLRSPTRKNTDRQGDPQKRDFATPSNDSSLPVLPVLPYCSQACLLGLKSGGEIDPLCPNAQRHRQAWQSCTQTTNEAQAAQAAQTARCGDLHPLSAEKLRSLLVAQLAEDMDHDCEDLEAFGMYGRIGVLFRLTLREYGYCLVAKGVQRVHRKFLAKEVAAYDILASCQGRLVPVNLGVVQLVDEYWTTRGAHITHMMLMAFGGEALCSYGGRKEDLLPPRKEVDDLCDRALDELRRFGVVHEDVKSDNLVWNEELQRVMVIDFDYSSVVQPWREEEEEEEEEGEKEGEEGEKEEGNEEDQVYLPFL